jgi:Ala-tRNA(Pro) deacylase
MPIHRLKTFLDGHHVKYVTISHSPAFTAQEIAALAHVSGKELAKTVIVKMDDRMAMAVLPAACQVDFEALKRCAGAKRVALASEQEFQTLFPECEVGAMPPFGNLYGMDVFAASELAEHKDMAFTAGSHTELIRLPYKDFVELVKPKPIRLR